MRLLALLLSASIGQAAVRYVSAAGNDGSADCAITAPCLTLSRAQTVAVSGDSIYLRRGDRWRQGPLVVHASTLTYGAYGVGAAPIVDGSDLKSWTNTSGNIWTAAATDDPFFVMFGGVTGTKAANAGAVDAANEWFWASGTLTVFHVGSPAATVEVPTREYGLVSQVIGTPRNTITIRDIEFRGARFYNIKNSSGNTWTVDNVIADHSGHGGMVFEVVDGITVRNSRVSYANQLGPTAFHEAITLQGVNGFTVADNTLYNNGEDGIDAKYNARNGTISGNVVYNGGTGPSIYIDAANTITVSGNYCHSSLVNDKAGIGLAVESGANPSNYNLHTITVVGNTVVGHATGIWIWLEDGAEAFADVHTIKIWHNTLTGNDKTNWGGIFVYGAGTAADYGTGNEIRNNIVYGNVGTQIWDIVSGGVVASEFLVTHNVFKSGDTVGVLGTNSITTADVLFVGSGSQPYTLQSGSPARNAATALAGISRLNIGAHETPTTWYAAPGSTAGSGTIGSPWTWAQVFAGPSTLKPGDTVLFREGDYIGAQYGAGQTNWTDTSIAGTGPNARITLKAYPGERPVVDGGIHFNGAWVDLIGFTFWSSYSTRISAQSGPFPTDMPLPDTGAYAQGIRLIHNVFLGQGNGFALWNAGANSRAYGNIVLYPGHQGTDRGHGHGCYIQNTNPSRHRIEYNFLGQTFGMGCQAFGTSVTALDNLDYVGNVFYNGGSMVNNFSRNLLVGGGTGVPAIGMDIRDNFSWTDTSASNAAEVNLGYWGAPGGGCAEMNYQRNTMIGVVAPAISISDGTASGALCGFTAGTGDNTIYGDNRGLTLPGTNRLLNSGNRPATAESKVFAVNEFEPGRAHIVVINWPLAATVAVDLAPAGWANGTPYVIRDAQDYFGTPVASGIYTGAAITLPMNRTTVTPVSGKAGVNITVPFAPVHTDELQMFVAQVGSVESGTSFRGGRVRSKNLRSK